MAIVAQTGDAMLIEAADPVSGEYVFGWLPQGGAGIDEVARTPCPRASDLGALHPQRRLECGRNRLTIDGWIVDVDVGGMAYRGRPAWLAERASLVLVSAVGPAVTPGGGLELHVPPDVIIGKNLVTNPDDPHAPRVRVVGHFSDPASGECNRTPEAEAYPSMHEEIDALWCAQQLVVESVIPAP